MQHHLDVLWNGLEGLFCVSVYVDILQRQEHKCQNPFQPQASLNTNTVILDKFVLSSDDKISH